MEGGGGDSLLRQHDALQARRYLLRLQRREPKLGAPRLQRRYDLVHIVADEAEAHIARVHLNDYTMHIQYTVSTYEYITRDAYMNEYKYICSELVLLM